MIASVLSGKGAACFYAVWLIGLARCALTRHADMVGAQRSLSVARY